MVTRAELTRLERHGFAEEDYAEFLKRKITRREDIQAHEETLQRAADVGAMERTERGEVGTTRRLGMTHEFERPEQAARIGETEARTATEKYGLGFKKEVEPTVKSILEQKETLGGLDIDVLEEELKGLRAPEGEAEVAKPTVVPPTAVAKPTGAGRKMRPSAKKFLWEGTPTKAGVSLPGLAAPIYGYYNLAQWLGHLGGKGAKGLYEYLYPKAR